MNEVTLVVEVKFSAIINVILDERTSWEQLVSSATQQGYENLRETAVMFPEMLKADEVRVVEILPG